MFFLELLPLLLGDWCRVWAGRGWVPIGATRYVPCIRTYARTLRWSVLTGMRPRTSTWVTGMSLGIKMKS